MRLAEPTLHNLPSNTDLVCFSHIRWDSPKARPQHLMKRFARRHRVFYIEEPMYETARRRPGYEASREDEVVRIVPLLPAPTTESFADDMLRIVVDDILVAYNIHDFIAWYYTPKALAFTGHLRHSACVYDCMDELTGSIGGRSPIGLLEHELLQRADVVFTNSHALGDATRKRHDNVHAFPSGIDVSHFRLARAADSDPLDLVGIPHPRLGYHGIIDGRLDYRLIDEVAHLQRDWHFVLVGPVVGIDPDTLPKAPNIHYLGAREYGELPAYMSGWDVAVVPFTRNASTHFSSPTNTPEYLAAGVPTVSTSISDVVGPYGAEALVEIADDAEDFIRAAERAMHKREDRSWKLAVERHLSGLSWDATQSSMYERIAVAYRSRADDYALLAAMV